MALVAVVSIVAFGAFGVMTASSMQQGTENALMDTLKNNGLNRGLPQLGGGADGEKDGGSNIPVYYVVSTYDGLLITEGNENVEMSDDVLKAAVEEVLSKGEGFGKLSDYGLAYRVEEVSYGYHIAFADITEVEATVARMVAMLAGFWLLLMLAMLVITVFLSRYVTRPVARAWADQQRFVADASHELKTPLTVILADVSILQRSPEKTLEEQQAWVDSIGHEAQRMQDLTKDLLTLARDDAGNEEQEVMSSVDFSAVVERTGLQFEAVAFERGLLIEDNVAPGLRVTGDAGRLENLVKTLLENACKYAQPEQPINLRLKAEGKHAVLQVENAGSISAEDLEHVFDRFYRSDRARTQTDENASFGLGLAIAKSTVELHGGSIFASSANGKTCFTVKIPLEKKPPRPAGAIAGMLG